MTQQVSKFNKIYLCWTPDSWHTSYIIDVIDNICHYSSWPWRFWCVFRMTKKIKDMEIPSDINWEIIYQ